MKKLGSLSAIAICSKPDKGEKSEITKIVNKIDTARLLFIASLSPKVFFRIAGIKNIYCQILFCYIGYLDTQPIQKIKNC